jgi:hypothetical protein
MGGMVRGEDRNYTKCWTVSCRIYQSYLRWYVVLFCGNTYKFELNGGAMEGSEAINWMDYIRRHVLT